MLPIMLYRSREVMAAHFRPVLAAHDLTDPQWRVLRMLGKVDEIDTAELARRSLLLVPSLSRILRDLGARGLISRRTDEEDNRRSFNFLTPAGASLIERVMPEMDTFYVELEEAMGVERIKRLNGLLFRLLEVMEGDLPAGSDGI
jgi:homoprotocatechuate degradation regulator HpaR